MRLTLRTLLAYLDNTLEPADAEILRQKVAESGFATQLVQKIRQKLSAPDLPAPSPDAIGPVHDANVISEYLDSTLPHEQVAEIERACLELDANLSEAAACHQILTMVLGNRADVPPDLRQRIYELPDREIEKLAASSDRFSSLSIADAPTEEADAMAQEAGIDEPLQTHRTGPDVAPESIKPVDINDSGVFDAPTRLRESDIAQASGPNFGGSSSQVQRNLTKEDRIYGGTIRPSRITPWLVSLGIVAALLFAMVQIFRPLLDRNQEVAIAKIDTASESIIASDAAPTTDDVLVPPPAETIPSPAAPPTDSTSQPPDQNPVPAKERPQNSAPENTATEPAATAIPEPLSTQETPVTSDSVIAAPNISNESESVLMPESPSSTASDRNETRSQLNNLDEPAPTNTGNLGSAEMVTPAATNSDSLADETETKDPLPALEIDRTIATIGGSQTLLASLGSDQLWKRVGEDDQIKINTDLICAPTFRGKLLYNETIAENATDGVASTSAAEITVIGPARFRWAPIAANRLELQIDFGRFLITSKSPSSTLSMKLGDAPVVLFFEDQETKIATSVKHFRKPGVNPLEAGESGELIGALTIQGQVSLQHQDQTVDLITGQQWIKRGGSMAEVSTFADAPKWITPPDPDTTTLASSARSGLLEIIEPYDSAERALREATLFRRSEVAALAANTLLQLGQSDVYFGGDGILSQPKQRQYWPEHYLSLVETMDRGPETADQMMRSIAKMDAANAAVLYRLLIGYSQKQLAEGGDKQLVDLLDSESMAVRVLALENLHQITGTTLYFRAETDSRARRTPAIRKWMVRQKKGDIRWPAGE